MTHQGGCELSCRRRKQEDGDQPPEHEQQPPQLVATAAPQDSTKPDSSLRPLPAASRLDQGHDEATAAMVAGPAVASAVEKRIRDSGEAITAQAGGGVSGGRLASRRYWWGDCLPHVALLREALLSSAPDIAVLGPLHGCFAFYTTHLHNEVLSSSYAKTLTFGASVTRLESAFMWVGGWRPTSALVLVYSLMGIDIENALQAVRAGRDFGDSSTASLLSTRQLAVMHSLQKHTQHAEMKISKKMTLLQMLIGDQDVLEAVLLDAASPIANDSSRFDQITEKRKSRLRRLLIQAEELRLHTLKDLLSLLTPIQAARCGVAVFELCSSLRTMGSTPPPILPALNILVLPVVIPPLPAPSGLVEKLSVARFGEAVALNPSSSVTFLSSSDGPLPNLVHSRPPLVADLSTSDNDIPNSSDIAESQSYQPGASVSSSGSPLHPLEIVIADLSTSDSSTPNSSDVSVSQSYETQVCNVASSPNALQTSDIQVSLAETAAVLLPELPVLDPSSSYSSCNYSTAALLLAQESSRPFIKGKKCKTWPTVLPLALPSLDDSVNGVVLPAHEHSGVGKGSKEKMISNRLLLLSPASSDVVIQNCSLDSPKLPDFELCAQRPLTLDDKGEYHQVEPDTSASADMGGSCNNQQGQMSVPCECAPKGPQSQEGAKIKLCARMWSSAQGLKCSLHQKNAARSDGWIGDVWRTSAHEIT